MVCGRCKSTIVKELEAAGYAIESIELGQVVVKGNVPKDFSIIESTLKQHGFEIIREETEVLIEKLKIALIRNLEKQEITNLSSFLTKTFNKSYSALSKLFSKTEEITIEKYFINLKIEKVKEYIQLGQLNFTEIAYTLNYKTSSHLARQFKTVTGMSMSTYKSLQEWNRKTLDQIV